MRAECGRVVTAPAPRSVERERCARSLFEGDARASTHARADVAQGEEDVEERPRQDEDVDRAEGVAAALDGAGESHASAMARRGAGLTTRSVVGAEKNESSCRKKKKRGSSDQIVIHNHHS